MAATLIFLQIKDKKGNFVAGESTAVNYAGQIEIESFTWGSKANQSQRAGAKVSTAVDYEVLEVTKFYDRATTTLCNLMSNDETDAEPVRFDYALLSFVDIVYGAEKSAGVPVLEIRLSDGYINSLRLNASPSGKSLQLRETVELSFRNIKMTYYTGGEDRASRGKGFVFEAHSASVES